MFAGGSSAPFVFFGFFSLLAPESAVPAAAGIASTVGAGNTNLVRRAPEVRLLYLTLTMTEHELAAAPIRLCVTTL